MEPIILFVYMLLSEDHGFTVRGGKDLEACLKDRREVTELVDGAGPALGRIYVGACGSVELKYIAIVDEGEKT